MFELVKSERLVDEKTFQPKVRVTIDISLEQVMASMSRDELVKLFGENFLTCLESGQ